MKFAPSSWYLPASRRNNSVRLYQVGEVPFHRYASQTMPQTPKALPTAGAAFAREPSRWGLRGDPFLWRAMRLHLANSPAPRSTVEARALLESAFAALTGNLLEAVEPFLLQEYAHGGMSGGAIDPDFWRRKALPLLTRRWLRLAQSSAAFARKIQKLEDGWVDPELNPYPAVMDEVFYYYLESGLKPEDLWGLAASEYAVWLTKKKGSSSA